MKTDNGNIREFLLVVSISVLSTLIAVKFNWGDNVVVTSLVKIVVPAAMTFGIIAFARSGLLNPRALIVFAYGLFFSVPLLTVTGQMGVLTGLAATSPNPFLYGYSFYSASLAFAIVVFGRTIELSQTLRFANPLLLVTGPIAVSVASTRHRSLRFRLDYFFPFFVVGAFLFVVIGIGLGPTLALRNEHNIVAGLLFGAFFELFIYANFAGLSLIVYGVAGIIGLRVPLNFKQPFSATNILDFWKGWHLSLSAVLKELFYKPVRAVGGTFVAVAATFLASAAWHGMTINFAIWGLIHALFYIFTIILLRANLPFIALLLFPPFLIVAKLIFGTADFGVLVTTLTTIPGAEELLVVRGAVVNWPIETHIAIALVVLLVVSEFLLRSRPHFVGRNYKFLRTRVSQVILMCAIILLSSGRIGEVIAVYGQR